MTVLNLPTGHTVTLTYTSTGFPPDDPGGLSINSTYLWVRVTREGWDSGWHRADLNSRRKAQEWFDLVETKADLREAWAGVVGGVWPPPRYDDVWREGVAWLNTL